MKTIKLEYKEDHEKRVKLDYRKQLLAIVNAPIGGQGGVSVADMRSAIKIADKLEVAKDAVELEDAEHEFLNARVQAWPWPLVHVIFLEFSDAVEKASSKSHVAGTETAKTEAAGA